MYCLASLLLLLPAASGVSVDPDMQTDALQDAPLRAEEGEAMFVFPSMQMARSSMVSYSSCRTGLRAVWALEQVTGASHNLYSTFALTFRWSGGRNLSMTCKRN